MATPPWLTNATNDGTLITLGAVGLLALAGAASSWKGPIRLGGGPNQGSASQYTDFMAQALPRFRQAGYSAPDAMRQAAAQWREVQGR